MKQEWKVERLEDLPSVVLAVIQALGPHRKIALYGEMGAGKTTFVKAFCAALGIEGEAVSPTFSLLNTYNYRSMEGESQFLHHLDLYRLSRAEEALDIGIEDVLYDDSYCLIEWPQVVEAYLPSDCVRLHIIHTEDQNRLIRWIE